MEELLAVLVQELHEQSRKHKLSAIKNFKKYASGDHKISLYDIVKLEVTSLALSDFARALTIEKVNGWREKHQNNSH